MHIRLAEDRDLDAIVGIHNQAILAGAIGFTVPFVVSERREWLASHSAERPLVVAEVDGVVIGWAHLRDYRPGRPAFRHTAEISYHVHADHRREGVATTLIEHLIARSSSLEVRTLVAIVLDANRASRNLLKKLGFEVWGAMPDVAQFDGEDVGHVYFGYRVDPQRPLLN